MDIVVLMGAGAEPAQSIARRLVGMGARVYGLAHKFPEQGFTHRDFIPVGVNPADPVATREAVEKIAATEGAIGAIILAGHSPVEDAFESAHPHDVALAVFAGLAAPLAAVRAATPGLIRRRGLLVAITRPVFGPGAALGAVVEAGLSAFCDGLFSELRDTGVRVCHLRIQDNTGPADPAARFTNAPQTRVQPDIVADTIESVIRLRENNAITRLVLRPQATREEPRLPVTGEPRLAALQIVQLPTAQHYPAPDKKIFTPEYRRPDYAPPPEDMEIEEDDDSDESVDPELAYLIKPRHRDHVVREPERAPAPRLAPVRPAPLQEEDAEMPSREAIAERRPEPAFRGPGPRQPDAGRRDPRDHARPDSRENARPDPRAHQHPLHSRDHRQSQAAPAQTATPAPVNAPRDASRDLHPGYRRQQEELARQQQLAQAGGAPQPQPGQPQGAAAARPPRPMEQQPRPPGWQGPRLPQNLPHTRPAPHADARPVPHAGQNRHDNQAERAAPTPAAPPVTEPPTPASTPAPAPVAVTPVAVAAPTPAPVPLAAPQVTPHESSRESSAEPAEKRASGRSEAVTLSFAKPAPAPVPAAAPVAPEPEAAPVAPDKPAAKPTRKAPATKKAAAPKPDKTGTVHPDAPEPDAPAKPKRARTPKKAE